MHKQTRGVLNIGDNRRFLQSIQSNEVKSKMKSMFGRLRTVDPEVANKTRERLTKVLQTLPQCRKDILSMLRGEVDQSEYQSTAKWFEFVEQIDDFIAAKVHDWPVHAVFLALYQFREMIIAVDNETYRAVRDNKFDNIMRWPSQNKEFLPAANERDRINFALWPELLERLFPHIIRLNIIAKMVLKHCIYPQYKWEPIFERKSRAAYARLPSRTRQHLSNMREPWVRQLPNLYLEEIGVASANIDWNPFVEEIKQLTKEEAEGLARDSSELIGKAMDHREVTNILSKPLLRSIKQNIDGQLKEPQKH